MNRKELSEVVAECAARTERAQAGIEEARQRQEAAAASQEESTARQEAATARWEATQADAAERNGKLDGVLERADALIAEMRADRAQAEADRLQRQTEWEEEKAWREDYLRRLEKMVQEFLNRADDVIVEIREQREDLRAMKEAILKLLDRFPPPPPSLRSA